MAETSKDQWSFKKGIKGRGGGGSGVAKVWRLGRPGREKVFGDRDMGPGKLPRGDWPLTHHLFLCTCSLSSEELAAFQKERAAFLAAQKEADLAAQAEAAKK